MEAYWPLSSSDGNVINDITCNNHNFALTPAEKGWAATGSAVRDNVIVEKVNQAIVPAGSLAIGRITEVGEETGGATVIESDSRDKVFLQSWLNSGTNRQVTVTAYDQAPLWAPSSILGLQHNLRKRYRPRRCYLLPATRWTRLLTGWRLHITVMIWQAISWWNFLYTT